MISLDFRKSGMKPVVTSCLLLVLSACGGSEGNTSTPPSTPSAETINGISVPPPPPSAMSDATIAGIDTDHNGVRDDIDRKIATEFGSNSAEYANALAHAQTLQAAIATPSAERSAAHIAKIVCLSPEMLARTSPVTLSTVNTGARREAYAEAFAGATIEDCAK